MSARYPKPSDGYPIIQLKDTDKSLASDVRTQNNTRYAYFKTIARGGKCVIQSCKDLHLGRVICYKKLHAEIAEDPYEQMRFLREARVTAMLQHPNTAPVYELGRDTNGHYYFTMKLIAGVTLREVLDNLRAGDEATTRAWDLDRLIDVMLQVCQALDYAHVHGVVHRDVKPENIVVGAFGEVLLLDWGLAKVWDDVPEQTSIDNLPDVEDKSLTSQGPLQATPLYMSPEQANSDPNLDHRTDIYSFGAILFEALTLQQLGWGDTLEDMLRNIRHVTPPPPSVLCPDRDIPLGLETTCMRCIQKVPDHRIQHMRELIYEMLYYQRLRFVDRPT